MPKKNRAVAQCPKLGSILFAVMKTDGTPIKGATVSVAGPTPGSAQTDKDGFAQFPNRNPGDYTATVTLGGAQQGLKLEPYQKALSVSQGSESYGLAKAKAVGKLLVEIYDDLNHPVKDVIQFAVGAEAPKPGESKHQMTFEELAEGEYSVTAQLPSGLYDTATASKSGIKVPAGGTGKARLEVKIVNTAKPKISIDKKEIKCGYEPPKDKPKEDIHIFLPKNGPTEKPAEVAKIMLSYEETRPEKPYKGDGILSLAGANVEAFSDQDCKQPLAGADGGFRIANAKLKSGTTVYVKGKAEGELTATLSLNATSDPTILVAAPQQANVSVKALNIVEPKIEVEYKVVMKDRELAQHQKLPDTKAGSAAVAKEKEIHPDPTYIVVSAKQGDTGPRYTGGGKLDLTPGNVEVFSDKECKTVFDISKKLTNDQLFGATPLKLFLRGKAAGKFTAKLTLDPSSNGLIEVLGPAEGEMGVVELKFKVHYYKKDDVNKAVNPDVPDITTYWNELKNLALEQKAMTDAEKVTPGRLLHKQDGKHYARAKLILEKLEAGQWPDGTDKYTVVFDQAKSDDASTGSVALYDAEIDGTKKDFPHKIEVSQAKAQEHTLWLEGTAAGAAWRDVRLDAGIDRPEGGPAREAKRNGDFAHFTPVEIKEVVWKVENEAGKEKVLDGDKFFINLDANGRILKTVAGSRKIEVSATLAPALKEVDIYFMLVENKANYELNDITSTWQTTKISQLKKELKHQDKDDRQKLLHFSKPTEDGGVAKIDKLQLSQFGGQQFKIGAYLDQDPHLAKYVEGHADLGTRQPKMSSDWRRVWRRLFYRVVYMQRWSGTSYADRFQGGDIETAYSDQYISLENSGAAVEKPYESTTRDILTWTRSAFGGAAAPARTLYLGLLNSKFKQYQDKSFSFASTGNVVNDYAIEKNTFDDVSDKSTWLQEVRIDYDGTTQVANDTATLVQTEDFKHKLTIDVTALYEHYKNTVNLAKAEDFKANFTVDVDVQIVDSPSGSSLNEATVVCMHTREPKHSTQDAGQSARHTFLHEIGHYVGLGSKFLPDDAGTQNPDWEDWRGQGNHCEGLGNNCIMWYQFKMTLAYCETCKLALRARTLHSPKVRGDAAY